MTEGPQYLVGVETASTEGGMGRRPFIRALGGLGVAATFGRYAAIGEAAAIDRTDWRGVYSGQANGRDAVLVVSEIGSGRWMELHLLDEERDRDFRGVTRVPRGSNTHVVSDVQLRGIWGTTESMFIPRLYLHTWNMDHISGFYRSGGTEYGLAFSETDVRAASNSQGALDRSSDPNGVPRWVTQWVGEYIGRQDGRRARLDVNLSGQGPSMVKYQIILRDLEHGSVFNGWLWKSFRSSSPHILFNVVLTAIDGSGNTKEYPRLFLHTSDADYISAYDQWQGREFGAHWSRT